MIDIHCHLLPGIDDGPKSWEESLDLAQAMVDDGIATAVATPHLIDGVYGNTRTVVEPLVVQLRDRLKSAGIELRVEAAAEVDLSSRHVTSESLELPLLGGNAVLLEMPMAVIPHAMADILFGLRSRGILPVLAHPERNELLQDNVSLCDDWLQSGAALQLDADSLLGVWGHNTQRCAERLLQRGKYHAMASDAHSTQKRPPRMREALEVARGIVGDAASGLVNKGPSEILAGRVPVIDYPEYSHKRAPDTPRRSHTSPWYVRVTRSLRIR
jgi:protein-tyrosine phosphatase